jgi:hypothetical protein
MYGIPAKQKWDKVHFSHRIQKDEYRQNYGTKLLVPNAPKLSALRQMPKNPVANKNYFVLLANLG